MRRMPRKYLSSRQSVSTRPHSPHLRIRVADIGSRNNIASRNFRSKVFDDTDEFYLTQSRRYLNTSAGANRRCRSFVCTGPPTDSRNPLSPKILEGEPLRDRNSSRDSGTPQFFPSSLSVRPRLGILARLVPRRRLSGPLTTSNIAGLYISPSSIERLPSG